MTVSNSLRCQLIGTSADEEYARLLSSGGHLVYIGSQFETPEYGAQGNFIASSHKAYTVTLVHQLKCLDIIRRDLTDDSLEAPT
ncbi:uncharacterized protein C8Q71DRAFT_769488 [Rhodofomes roseus]|uniref:Uncharacterized protein n=1 Tax=Rhodofomes roseus TaxID=34475 RepID=A0ABQ8KAX4_9APHY|nr:uncharacterized protein C8Q71DRAFT_769488 [Rhodofomes roseus]KAH9834538.1 hypothetical protein C8Q71DRAFT_769488 [Rhodofomes roseus]